MASTNQPGASAQGREACRSPGHDSTVRDQVSESPGVHRFESDYFKIGEFYKSDWSICGRCGQVLTLDETCYCVDTESDD